ncbi:MAG: MFS transporter, partial [Candidatus Kapabacteria bacterium]|nr:MFS transporter [Candidatus Kapabacteria bacterium]
MLIKNRERVGWYFYDWANSAFTTSVITVFIGPYLTSITRNVADSFGYIKLFGIEIYSDALFGYVISLSVLLQVLILPIIGSIADKHQNKKLLLGIFAYLGATSTILLYFLKGDNYLFGSALLLVANLSFGASVVVY